MTSTILRRIKKEDLDWVLAQHRSIYMEGHGFDESFERLVAEILDNFFSRNDQEFERGWVAEVDGKRLGAVFCMRIDASTAQLRLFFLVPEARGKGLGRQMVRELVAFARQAGYTEIKLWTHQSHHAACALYRKTGWTLLDQQPTQSFGKDEVIETYLYRL